MDENDKTLTTEEALKHLMKTTDGEDDEINRFVDLIIDLIAERSEEKAEEAVDKHERNHDHDFRRAVITEFASNTVAEIYLHCL